MTGTRDAERGLRKTPLTVLCLLYGLALESGLSRYSPHLLLFASRVPRSAPRGF